MNFAANVPIKPSNTHPMVTREKSGIVKKKVFTAQVNTHTESTKVKEALASLFGKHQRMLSSIH